jgi:hypothetical protein
MIATSFGVPAEDKGGFVDSLYAKSSPIGRVTEDAGHFTMWRIQPEPVFVAQFAC